MIEISGPSIITKQIPNVILPNDPSDPSFTSLTTTSGITAFSLSLTGNLTVNGSAAITGALTAGGDPVASTGQTNTWTAAQTFDDDVRFKSGSPWHDAVGYGADPTRAASSTTAFNSALTAADADTAGTIYAPKGASDWLTDPWTWPAASRWNHVRMDDKLNPTASFLFDERNYWFEGGIGGQRMSFGRRPCADVAHNSLDPVIDINVGSAGGPVLSNLCMPFATGDGILIHGGTPMVTLDNIQISENVSGTGSPLHIQDSFGFYMRDMNLQHLGTGSTVASLDLTGPTGAGATRIVRCSNCFFSGGGVKMGPTDASAAATTNFLFDFPLFEALTADNSYFVIDSTNATGKIGKVTLINPEFADAVGDSYMFKLIGNDVIDLIAINPSPVGTALFAPASPNPSSAIFLNPNKDCSNPAQLGGNVTAGVVCIGTATPFCTRLWSNNAIQGAALGTLISTGTTSRSLLSNEGTLLCNAGTISLPAPADSKGLEWTFYSEGSGCTVTPTGGGTIDGLSTYGISVGAHATIVSDGTNYRVKDATHYRARTMFLKPPATGSTGLHIQAMSGQTEDIGDFRNDANQRIGGIGPDGNWRIYPGDASANHIKLVGTPTAARTATFPNADVTVAGINLAQTWTAAQTFTSMATATNCADGAGDAACGSAVAGSVVIDAADTDTVVSTTGVTADSQIFIQEDSSLGTRLSVTCNTDTGRTYTITARTAATSFTVTASGAPTTNPACLSYSIVN